MPARSLQLSVPQLTGRDPVAKTSMINREVKRAPSCRSTPPSAPSSGADPQPATADDARREACRRSCRRCRVTPAPAVSATAAA